VLSATCGAAGVVISASTNETLVIAGADSTCAGRANEGAR
jgi:hypothetical protein